MAAAGAAWRGLGALFLACAAGAAGAGFVPFADVQELKPRRIHDFCRPGVLPSADGQGKLRRCAHHFKKTLDDDSDIELGWSMDVDPDSILSLDTEAEHGVRLTHCGPGVLELELPESHARHAVKGKLIVGSRFTHQCAHRPDLQLYHRVREVPKHEWRNVAGSTARVAHVRLVGEELASIAHAVPKLSFHFSWMPSEAKDWRNPFPKMKTDFGLNRKEYRAQRRLWGLPKLPKSLSDIDGASKDNGGFASGGQADGNFDTDNGILNLMPKQLSNFGWNWDFFVNTTASPDYDLNAPGLKGKLKIRKPYVKVHSGIYLNFSSEFVGITTAPKVQWTAGIKGHGRVQARMLGSMNTTGQPGTSPISAFKLPVFEEFNNPKWFGKVDFATGSLPIAVEPGFQASATLYHKGTFHGAVGGGGRTQGWMNPALHFDSLKGFETTFKGNLTDTKIWPPLWLIFTKQFELGIITKPSFLFKGDFAGLERATMAIEGRPFVNVTIKREGGNATGTAAMSSGMQMLTVYPLRVMGLKDVSFNTKYQVNISANGHVVATTPTVNWGIVENRNHISQFNCGPIAEKVLMNPAVSKINITLFQVTESSTTPQTTVLGTGTVTCTSIVKGECEPAPATVEIKSPSGSVVASVQLAILWQDNPAPWFASKIRGLAISLPTVVVRQDTLTASFPSAPAPVVGSNASTLAVHLLRSGQTYVFPLAGTIGTEQSALSGTTTLELPPGFTDTWLPCSGSATDCDSPTMQLWSGGTQVASAAIPAIQFDSSTSMQGTSSGGFMAGTSSSEMNVPSTVALTTPGNSGVTIALVTMQVKAIMTLASSIFLQPRSEVQVAAGGKETLQWTVSDVDRSQAYSFTVKALVKQTVPPANSASYYNYQQVNGNVLAEVKDSAKTFSQTCSATPAAGVPASSTPCSFSYDFTFGSGFASGDQAIIQVSWTSGGSTHQLNSPPIQVGVGRRRLAAPGPMAFEAAAGAAPRRLFSKAAWKARIDKHNASCTKRDLHFNLGMGMLVRGKIGGISVPAGFPMIGGLSEDPELATDWRKVGGKQPGKDLREIMGGNESMACQVGLCAGQLPGCSEGGTKWLSFPKLVFDFNRQINYKNDSRLHGMIQKALAYCFSTLPEMVDVAIQQMNESSASKPTPTEAPVEEDAWWRSRPAPAPAPTVASPSPSPAPEKSSLSNVFNKFFSPGRRLQAEAALVEQERRVLEGLWGGRRLEAAKEEVVGSHEQLPRTLKAHQARLEFPHGLHFTIDRPLVEMMLQHGYFKHLEDMEDLGTQEHGPLRVTRFYVDSGHVSPAGAGAQTPAAQASRPSSAPTFLTSSLVAAVAATGFVAIFVLGATRSATSPRPSDASDYSDQLVRQGEEEHVGAE